MRWTERQRAMLRAMGVELFERAPVQAAAVPRTEPVVEVAARDSLAVEVVVEVETQAKVEVEVAVEAKVELEAEWLVVGEPIDDEADPTGAQAQLLDNMLRAIGASRSAPSRRGRALFFAYADKPAQGSEAERREQLRRSLAAVRPACAIALGRAAAQALLGSEEALGSLRGRAHRAGGTVVVASCSLAFLLRHPEEKARAWADLCLAVRSAEDAAAGVTA